MQETRRGRGRSVRWGISLAWKRRFRQALVLNPLPEIAGDGGFHVRPSASTFPGGYRQRSFVRGQALDFFGTTTEPELVLRLVEISNVFRSGHRKWLLGSPSLLQA